MKIIYENRDFSWWMQEKNGNIICDCYLILESCSDEQSKDNAYAALYNALTIQFFLCDKLDVCKTLLCYFVANDYTEYKKWHKLIFESDKNKKYEFSDVGVIDKEILSLITEDGWEKSRIPEMINHCKCSRENRWLTQLENDYEQVAMGEITWREFYESHCNDYERYVHLYSFNDFLRMIEEKTVDEQDEI